MPAILTSPSSSSDEESESSEDESGDAAFLGATAGFSTSESLSSLKSDDSSFFAGVAFADTALAAFGSTSDSESDSSLESEDSDSAFFTTATLTGFAAGTSETSESDESEDSSDDDDGFFVTGTALVFEGAAAGFVDFAWSTGFFEADFPARPFAGAGFGRSTFVGNISESESSSEEEDSDFEVTAGTDFAGGLAGAAFGAGSSSSLDSDDDGGDFG
jgi:hypothetical protein